MRAKFPLALNTFLSSLIIKLKSTNIESLQKNIFKHVFAQVSAMLYLQIMN